MQHTPISGQVDLAAVEAAARKLADNAEFHAARSTMAPVREGYLRRAADLRHIAADAACANDPEYPCDASLQSVLTWLWDDTDLARASQQSTWGMGA